ncbi:MAG: hypothetical protein ACI9RM_001479, partial [Ulvibacter sp.]
VFCLLSSVDRTILSGITSNIAVALWQKIEEVDEANMTYLSLISN